MCLLTGISAMHATKWKQCCFLRLLLPSPPTMPILQLLNYVIVGVEIAEVFMDKKLR